MHTTRRTFFRALGVATALAVVVPDALAAELLRAPDPESLERQSWVRRSFPNAWSAQSDATAQLQRCIDEGRVLPAGTFYLSRPLLLRSGQRALGASAKRTRLVPAVRAPAVHSGGAIVQDVTVGFLCVEPQPRAEDRFPYLILLGAPELPREWGNAMTVGVGAGVTRSTVFQLAW